MFVRVEVAVRPEFQDPAAALFLRRVELAHADIRRKIRWLRVLDVYWIDLDAPREQVIPVVLELFQDSVLNWLFTGDLIPSAAGHFGGMEDLFDSAPIRSGKFWGLERRFRPGVTDNVGRTVVEALGIVLPDLKRAPHAASGSLVVLEGPELTEDDLALLARDVHCNELIESWTLVLQEELEKNSRFHPEQVAREIPKVNTRGKQSVGLVELETLSDEDLIKLSRDRLWALNRTEMRVIREYFADTERRQRRHVLGLDAPTDVELEILAQTWSEHCKHKIFNARITYASEAVSEDPGSAKIPSEIRSLFQTTIASTTQEIPRPWLLSVFSDNAGMVALDDVSAFCIKVETHNSPSALDPYGGALTGIVGVNRDILGCGRGAKPIFNTNVFCLAVPDTLPAPPQGLLHPRRILDGVRRGVEHGGNKSGIPTVNGALVFHPRYVGKPLIFCGTGGLMPRISAGMKAESKEIQPGDCVCMVGGRIGKDGIHGATFSSLALDEQSPAAAVQLGDPITQKRMSDFLLEARELGLYRTLTDNGAGGLSSSVGELAQITGGVRIDVAKALTKYAGLKPYELVVSESQERMTVAVPPEKLAEFISLARSRATEVSVLGEFNQSGLFEILYEGKCIAALELHFLHKGCPVLELNGVWKGPPSVPGSIELSFRNEGPKTLLQLLGRPGIASKEWLIRQYDHEVQGTSVIKPLHTVAAGTAKAASGPNDGGVVRVRGDSSIGVAVGCGIHPKLSAIDPYLMAQAAVDEAIRNVLCVGGEYGRPESVIALVDNFCWPDPVGDEEKTAALVRACFGLRDSALALGIPLVSGKDSMKNDFRGRKDGKEFVISVPPTLLMTAVAKVSDIRHARSADFKGDSDKIYLLGGAGWGLLGSELHAMYVDRLQERGGNERQVVLPVSPEMRAAGDQIANPPSADWKRARAIFAWLGGSIGRKQSLLRSAHDISDGGILVALAECLIARGLGARVRMPESVDPWIFGFGEGFHSFIVTVKEAEAPLLEADWTEQAIPFMHLGEVTLNPLLQVAWNRSGTDESWQVPTSELAKAWVKEKYWE